MVKRCQKYKNLTYGGWALQSTVEISEGALIHDEKPLLELPKVPIDFYPSDLIRIGAGTSVSVRNSEESIRAFLDRQPPTAIKALTKLYGGPDEESPGSPRSVASTGSDAELRALIDIADGTDIFVDYLGGIDETLQAGSERRKILRENYGFTCTCIACGPYNGNLPRPETHNRNRNAADDAIRIRAHNLFKDNRMDLSPRTQFLPKELTANLEDRRIAQLGLVDQYIRYLKDPQIRNSKLLDAYQARARYHELGYYLANRRVSLKKPPKGLAPQDPCEYAELAIQELDKATSIGMTVYGRRHPIVEGLGAELLRIKSFLTGRVSPWTDAARRAARIALFNETNVHLSPGPSHPIRHSTVTEKHESGTLSGVNPVHPSTGFCSAESYDCKDETNAGNPSNTACTSAEQVSRLADSTLDGVADVRPANCPLHCRDRSSQVHVSKTATADVDELHWHDNSSSPPPGPPTRRHYAASSRFVVHDDPDELQDLIRNRHLHRLPSNEFHPDIPPPVPELVLSAAQVVTEPPVLDPGAPVFVPRIRLANTTCSSEDDPTVNWGSLDSTRNSAHLRLRTSSEQNAEQHSIRQEDNTQLRARSGSGISNQDNGSQDHVPILERYPLLRPPARQTASINHRTHPAVATAPSQFDNGDYDVPTHFIQPRSSSLAWGRTVTLPANIPPSTTDGSNSVGSAPASRDPSAEHRWDATTEFLNMRRSPLDELTETLSRLSAARPRSVANPSSEPTQIMRMQIAAQVPPEEPLSLDDLALLPRVHSPHSSPIPAPSPELPSTPPRPAVNLSSPRRPLDQRSPAKAKEALTPGSAIRRKPVPGAGATPKVKVYNDSEPPDTQPQTPADVLR
ncbi:hypothetical protein D0859_06791 [Hortaea werneckii]|uniref:SET domain-containing protein n=1 Tax=Hortaea werneckii TaxID=91943 RepID=A0A3M7IUB1_HORWE|nr:hypothetical protein D0859_06791 [Hortaea werneckii]